MREPKGVLVDDMHVHEAARGFAKRDTDVCWFIGEPTIDILLLDAQILPVRGNGLFSMDFTGIGGHPFLIYSAALDL